MEFHDDEPCESGAPRKADQLWPAERAFSLVERSSNHSEPALPRREKTILQKLYQDDCSRVEKMMKADECGSHWWNYDQATLCLNPVMHFNKNTNMYLYDKCRTLSIEASC